MTFFHNKHMRLGNFSYEWRNHFFITICTAYRNQIFGEVVDKKMRLSDCGKIAEVCWCEIPDHHQKISIDEYIIMPDHMHGILCLDTVDNRHAYYLNQKPQHNRLSVIVGSFKSAVAKKIRMSHPDLFPIWQKSFHDRLIRSNIEMEKIRDYIKKNPGKFDNNSDL
ncbi:hypothetical protein GF391_03210 [Candidatus Uhrbacteria bacterium]|nr:hypothetical protein [Candidatus Uhrbacteria bacterium]